MGFLVPVVRAGHAFIVCFQSGYTIAYFSKLLPESQWLRCPHMFSYHGGQEMAESRRMAESI